METKTQQYNRQSKDAQRDILLNWPQWQRHNMGFDFKDPTKQAVYVVLEEARRGSKHTTAGHDCEICEAMRTVANWLIDG